MVGQFVGSEQATIESLLSAAIRLEAAARRFYEGLARKFAHCPEVAEFWGAMAADELGHENWLLQWGASLNAERRSQPVETWLLQMGQRLLDTSAEELLKDVRNLDDAYETAHELESSEMNVIFRFFIKEFARDARLAALLLHDLDEHAERLMTRFPACYTTREMRVGVQAV